MQLSGNTILITGGGTGIGRALAEAFHAEGNEVIIAGRRKERLESVVAANPGMKAIQLDISDSASIGSFADQMKREYPALNVIVHNAGIMKVESVRSGDAEIAEEIIATNLLGPIRLNAALLPFVEKQSNAVLITVSSGFAFVPGFLWPTFCASKAAVHSYTQSLRYQLKDVGVQVIELIPPYVQTELLSPEQTDDPDAMPVKDFVAEVMQILKCEPGITEVSVERVQPLRLAEASGRYEIFFKQLNDLWRERYRFEAGRPVTATS